jgi:hypothetical protein
MKYLDELAGAGVSSRTSEVQLIMVYQNGQVVLSQLSPFSGPHFVKPNLAAERPEVCQTQSL